MSGWQRNVWRFLYRNHLEQLHWDVLEQDRIILETLRQMRVHEILISTRCWTCTFTPFNEES